MKRAFTFVEALIVVAVVVIAAAFLLPLFARARDPNKRISCQSNLRRIGQGLGQYVQDWDERFPSAHATSSTGWADVLQPYVKSRRVFQCPSVRRAGGFSGDYFYNRRLARVALASLSNWSLTIMLGDGEDDAPTWNSWVQMPADAVGNASSPSQRHLGLACYCFSDGHVKMMKPSLVSSTFA